MILRIFKSKYGEILERIVGNDPTGFDMLYQKSFKMLTNKLLRIFPNTDHQILGSAMNDTLLEIARKIRTQEITYLTDSFLVNYSKHKYRQFQRKYALKNTILTEYFSDSELKNVQPENKDQKDYSEIQKVLKRLGEPCKTLLLYKHVFDYSHEELTELESFKGNESAKGSRVRLSRCKRKYLDLWDQLFKIS